MLRHSPMETMGFDPNKLLLPSEVLFDALIASGQLDSAQRYVESYVDQLVEQATDGVYTDKLFHASLKEIAMPMYRMFAADSGGKQFFGSRELTPEMFVRASGLMTLLQEYESYYEGLLDQPDFKSNRLSNMRGHMSELTVFSIFASEMSGHGDDFTIMPSTSADDQADRGGSKLYRGYDFLVHDRDNDSLVKLQVKASTNANKRYTPDIVKVFVRETAELANTTVPELQNIIAAGDRDNPALKRMHDLLVRTVRHPHRRESSTTSA